MGGELSSEEIAKNAKAFYEHWRSKAFGDAFQGEAMNNQIGYMQTLQPTRCECHDCTQARWKMSLQGQMQIAQSSAQSAGTQMQPQPGQVRVVGSL